MFIYAKFFLKLVNEYVIGEMNIKYLILPYTRHKIVLLVALSVYAVGF